MRSAQLEFLFSHECQLIAEDHNVDTDTVVEIAEQVRVTALLVSKEVHDEMKRGYLVQGVTFSFDRTIAEYERRFEEKMTR